MMKRIVSKGARPHFYVKICLEFEKSAPEVCSSEFRQIVASCLKSLFGEVGASLCVDILKYRPTTRTAILRVPQHGYVKLRSALTLFGSYRDQLCAFRFLQASAHLLALADNSRTLDIG